MRIIISLSINKIKSVLLFVLQRCLNIWGETSFKITVFFLYLSKFLSRTHWDIFVSTLCRIRMALCVAELNAALCLLTRARKWIGARILNISFPRVGIESTTCRVYSCTFVPLRHDWPRSLSNYESLISTNSVYFERFTEFLNDVHLTLVWLTALN